MLYEQKEGFYLRDALNKTNPITETVNKDMVEAYYDIYTSANSNKFSRDFAYNQLLSFLLKVYTKQEAKYIASATVDMDDYDNVIAMTLFKALKNYKKSKNSAFLSYIANSLQRELFKEYKVSLTFHVPHSTGASKKEMDERLRNFNETIISLDGIYNFDNGDMSVGDYIEGDIVESLDYQNPIKKMVSPECWEESMMILDFHKKVLSLENGKILYLYYGLDRGFKRSVREVGEIVQLSPKQIQNRITKGLIEFATKYPEYEQEFYAA